MALRLVDLVRLQLTAEWETVCLTEVFHGVFGRVL